MTTTTMTAVTATPDRGETETEAATAITIAGRRGASPRTNRAFAEERLYPVTKIDIFADPLLCRPRSRRSPSYEPPRMARSPSPQCVSLLRSILRD